MTKSNIIQAILEEYQAKLDETQAIINKPRRHTTEELQEMIKKMMDEDSKTG